MVVFHLYVQTTILDERIGFGVLYMGYNTNTAAVVRAPQYLSSAVTSELMVYLLERFIDKMFSLISSTRLMVYEHSLHH